MSWRSSVRLERSECPSKPSTNGLKVTFKRLPKKGFVGNVLHETPSPIPPFSCASGAFSRRNGDAREPLLHRLHAHLEGVQTFRANLECDSMSASRRRKSSCTITIRISCLCSVCGRRTDETHVPTDDLVVFCGDCCPRCGIASLKRALCAETA